MGFEDYIFGFGSYIPITQIFNSKIPLGSWTWLVLYLSFSVCEKDVND